MTTANKRPIVKAKAPPKKNDPCPFSIDEIGIYDALIQFLAKYFPGILVVNGQVNRTALPKPPLILIQSLIDKRLSTNETRYSDDSMFTKMITQKVIRLDFYGSKSKSAADLAMRFQIIWNDSCAFDFFKQLKIPLFPLYPDPINLRPFVNGEDQFSDRYSCDAHFEYHPEVKLPQDSATELIMSVGLANGKSPP